MTDNQKKRLLDYPVEVDETVSAADRRRDLILISFLLLLHYAFRFVAALFPSEWYRGIVLFFGTLVPIIVFLLSYRERSQLSHWLRHPVHVKESISVFPVLLLLGLGLSYLQSFLVEAFPNVGTPVLPHTGVLQILLFDLLLPAVGEELLFRGVVLQRLRHYGMRAGIIVSAIAFAVAHGNWLQIPYAFIAGILLGGVTLYTHSVIPAIALHFLLNFTSVELSLLPADLALPICLAVLAIALLFSIMSSKYIARIFRKIRRKERKRSVPADTLAMLLSALGVVLLAELILSFRWF